MRRLRVWLWRLGGLFGGERRDRELQNELDSHLRMEIDDNLERGMAPEEARREALLLFEGIEQVKEMYRDQRGLPLLETTWQDARYAVRTLRKNPGTTLVGILVMALAIGANTAVFSIVDAVLLNPLPYEHPDRIVTLTYDSSYLTGATVPTDRSRQVSIADFADWQRDSRSFDSMAAYTTGRTTVMASSVAEYAVIARVTPEFFRVFRVHPSTGRSFSDEEARDPGRIVAVLSDRYARQQFAEAARAIGQTVRLGNRSVPIVGVLPAAFDFPADTDMWLPMPPAPARQQRRANNYLAVARLADRVKFGHAQTEMTAISARLEQQYPEMNRSVRVRVSPLQADIVGDVKPMLYLIFASVAIVLLIACATMATLLLAKATARIPEIAVRGALGASAARIVRQLLVEAAVQSCAAGLIGVGTAVAGTKALVALSPPNVPRLADVAVNGHVLLFTLGLCVFVSLLFGLPPALQAARMDVNERLRPGGGRVTGGAGGRMREALVVAEIALAVILVATGVLLVRSVVALQQAPLGFRGANVLLMQATALPSRPDWTDSRMFFQELLADLRQVPGVVAAGAMMGPPGRVGSESGYWIDHMPQQSAMNSARPAVMNVIAPGAFDALGVPILQGRDFHDGDRADAPSVVIVNQALARAAFAGRDPLGRALVAGFDSQAPMTIVGVVGDVRQYGPDREPQPEIYMPYQQHFYNGATLHVVVKTAADPAAIALVVPRKARERSPEVSVRVTTMDDLLAEQVATPKFRAWLLSLFGAVALCLAIGGAYGVMAYVTGQRSKEIGVRMALGATEQSVLWLMVGRGLKLAGVGLSAGVVGAIIAARLVRGMLFEVEPHDVATYLGVVALLGLLSLLATYIPARRAMRVDPVVVLRQE
jgi:putative ABC transport system permease protein